MIPPSTKSGAAPLCLSPGMHGQPGLHEAGPSRDEAGAAVGEAVADRPRALATSLTSLRAVRPTGGCTDPVPCALEQTFLHLPGVTRRREATLWASGLTSWSELRAALEAGAAPRDLLRSRAELQLGLTGLERDAEGAAWAEALAAGQRALVTRDLRHFVDRLPAGEQWRILAAVPDEAVYLDIETTGLSRDLHAMTVVGVRHRGLTHQWAWPDRLDGLAAMLLQAPIVVTFNGARFDLPFLQHHVPSLPTPRVHIDLRWVAHRSDLRGGQKAAELALGLHRDAELHGLDGEAAIALWCRALYGEAAAYETLLAYNAADVDMLERLGRLLCNRLTTETGLPRHPGAGATSPASRVAPPVHSSLNRPSTDGVRTVVLTADHVDDENVAVSLSGAPAHRAAPHPVVRSAWRARRLTIDALRPAMETQLGRAPVVVGIDLRTKAHNPTGWVRAVAGEVEAAILFDDATIFERTIAAAPDLVSIDAPLSLPRGRSAVSDDSPCRAAGGIVRDAERILWSRGIRVYPALIKHMQGLTERGIELAARFRARGIEVIESYPGAAQDVLGIARKGVDVSILARGLADFGFAVPAGLSHDELDAITCVLVGYCYLAGRYEAIGAEDENFLIIPRAHTIHWPVVAPSGADSDCDPVTRGVGSSCEGGA